MIEIKLPYDAEILVPLPEPKLVYASTEKVDALRKTITQLTKESEGLQSKLQTLDKDHAKIKGKREEDTELLIESRKRAKIEERLKEK